MGSLWKDTLVLKHMTDRFTDLRDTVTKKKSHHSCHCVLMSVRDSFSLLIEFLMSFDHTAMMRLPIIEYKKFSVQKGTSLYF